MSSGQSRPLLSLTPVRGRPSGTGFDESRSAKRKDTRIYIGRVYDRWCAARKLRDVTLDLCHHLQSRTRKILLGTSAEQDDEKQLLLSPPYQRRLYRRPSTLTPVPASLVARSIAMLGFLPGRRRDWSDLVRPRWDRRHFSAAKNRQKITE